MTTIGTLIDDLETPCLLVDLDRLDGNIRSWQSEIAAHGVALRPHIKTHKSPEIAALQRAAGAQGITAAKLSEAECFVDHGFDDVFVAYPLIGATKWQRAAALARRCTLVVGVDSVVGAQGLSAAAVAAGSVVGVNVEVDTGLQRSGVAPGEAALLAQMVDSLPGLRLQGIFTFRGAHFGGAGGRSAAELGREEGELMVALAEEMRSAGLPITTVSVGSTPTARASAAVPGVTEVRPGTYVFGDYMQAAGGFMDDAAVALSILCTVVSRPVPGRAVIDGGCKTFSGDVVPERLGLRGYGRAVGVDAYVDRMSEEHGMVALGAGVDLPVGARVAFQPIHVCPTVNLSDELIGVRGGVVAQVFPVLARGLRV